jgi:hypothetical protein
MSIFLIIISEKERFQVEKKACDMDNGYAWSSWTWRYFDRREVTLATLDLRNKNFVCTSIQKLSSPDYIAPGNILPPKVISVFHACVISNELAGLTGGVINEKVWTASVCGCVRKKRGRREYSASEIEPASSAALRWFFSNGAVNQQVYHTSPWHLFL